MAETIHSQQDAKDWRQKHDPLAPKAGDPAPDFTLHDAKGADPVTLSSFRGERPVVLIFGSFT